MRERKEPEQLTLDGSLPEGLCSLCEEFERAWQAALWGGIPPAVDALLHRAPESERSILRAELTRLDQVYRRQLYERQTTHRGSPPLPATLLDSPPEPADDPALTITPGPATLGTVNYLPDPPHHDPNATLPPDAASAPKEGETLCLAGEGSTAGQPGTPRASATEMASTLDPGAVKAAGDSVSFALDDAIAERASPDLPFVPGYEVLGELGRGGMGVVYKARQKGLNRIVALKMVLSGVHAGSEQLARFTLEAEAIGHLLHPNIVQVYEIGTHDGLPYFSLEFVEGGSLTDKIAGTPQVQKEAAQLVEVLALAMAYAHQHGIVHRDIKPVNILLTADGLPKITDFGLAKRLEADSSQTRSGAIMGTPSYMAPEQARGDTHDIGPLADVYSLGAVLYELLTGRPPFLGTTLLDTLQQVRSREPVPPSRLQPTVHRDLETICLKCLEKEPHKRYPSAEELAEDLHRFLAGEPIKARPVGAAERLWRWCKRNPRVASLSAAVTVLLITVGVGLTMFAVRSARERETTAEARRIAQQRLDQATEATLAGRARQARILLQWSDPLVETNPALADVRQALHRLRDQVTLHAEFKELLDSARYYGLFGPKGTLQEARDYCRKLLALYDEIAQGTGRASCGMPPLDAVQQQLLQEDYFEAFLVSAQVEWELVARTGDVEAQKAAARKALAWLERAEAIQPQTWVLHSRRSSFLTKLGYTKQAEAEAQRAAKLRPTSPLDRFWFGLAQHMEGDAVRDKDSARAQEYYRRAIQEYAAVLRLRPDHFWAYFDSAACHFELGELNDALIGFTICTHIRPEVPWSYYNRGTILGQQRQYAAAIDDLTQALERNAQSADALCNRGLAYAGLDKLDQALADYDAALRLNPNLAIGYLHRADAYRKLKRAPDALADYDRALKLDPRNAAIYASRGAFFFASNDYAQARDDFARAIELQPNQENAYRMHGVASLHLQDFEAALRDWKELARLLPKSAEPYQNLVVTYKAMRRYDEALKAATHAIQIRPDDPKSYLYRAQLHHQLGQMKEALADHTFVLTKLKGGRAEVLNDYGDLLRTLGRFKEAAAAYERSLQLLPKQTDAYVGLGMLGLLQDRPELVESAQERMLAANPESFRAYLRRAELRRAWGQWAEALQDCDAAARLDPQSLLPALVRASIRAAQGEYRAAVAEAEALQQATRFDGQDLAAALSVWSLACGAARAAGDTERAEQYVDRAAALLGDVMSKGFLSLNFQAYNRLLVDPALAPIRQHPRVLELLPVLRHMKPAQQGQQGAGKVTSQGPGGR